MQAVADEKAGEREDRGERGRRSRRRPARLKRGIRKKKEAKHLKLAGLTLPIRWRAPMASTGWRRLGPRSRMRLGIKREKSNGGEGGRMNSRERRYPVCDTGYTRTTATRLKSAG